MGIHNSYLLSESRFDHLYRKDKIGIVGDHNSFIEIYQKVGCQVYIGSLFFVLEYLNAIRGLAQSPRVRKWELRQQLGI